MYTLDMKIGGFQSRSGHCKEEKEIYLNFRESNPGSPARRPPQYRPSYRGSSIDEAK